MKKQLNGNRIIYLDFIRIFAIFFVIYNHTSEMGYFLFASRPAGSFSFWLYMAISVVSKVSVPLFFCVSGALLLDKAIPSIGNLWRHKVLKMIFVLILFSVINYTNYCFYAGKEFKFQTLIKSMYSGPSVVNGHLWYIYAYIAFLICLPFLRALVKNLEDKYFQYMIAVMIVLQGLQILELFFAQGEVNVSENFVNNLWIAKSVVIYPCIGYYIHKRLDVEQLKKKILFLWGLNIMGIMASCYMTFYLGKTTGVLNEWYSQKYMECFVILNAICLFTTSKCFFEKRGLTEGIRRVIGSFGKATLGIYLIHQLVKCYFSHYEIIPKITAYGVDSMLAVILYCFGVLLASYAITRVLLVIPVVKRIIGG